MIKGQDLKDPIFALLNRAGVVGNILKQDKGFKKVFITQVLLSNKYRVGRLEPGRGLKLVSTRLHIWR